LAASECAAWGSCTGTCLQQNDTPACYAACDQTYSLASELYAPIYDCLCQDCSPLCSTLDPCAKAQHTKSLGLACSSGAECTSGFCVDGVCCNTSCLPVTAGGAASCHACNLSASACANGADCESLACVNKQCVPKSCAVDTDCASGHCLAGVCSNGGLCSRYPLGTTPAGVCANHYGCNSGGTCNASCIGDSDCVVGFGCNAAGVCM
jgi:hypothetical protein